MPYSVTIMFSLLVGCMINNTQPYMNLNFITCGCVKDLVEPQLVKNGATVGFEKSTLLSIPQNIIGVKCSNVNIAWRSTFTVVIKNYGIVHLN